MASPADPTPRERLLDPAHDPPRDSHGARSTAWRARADARLARIRELERAFDTLAALRDSEEAGLRDEIERLREALRYMEEVGDA